MSVPDDLGIPAGSPVVTGSNGLPEGWRVDWIGVRLEDPPAQPWHWPYIIAGTPATRCVVQVWSRTVSRPGFAYTVRWHPRYGRTYIANGSGPEAMSRLTREAQRVMRGERRGRPRRRPTPQFYMAAYDRIQKASGVPPSRGRMAEEYGVERANVRKWLQRKDWLASVPDKYRAE